MRKLGAGDAGQLGGHVHSAESGLRRVEATGGTRCRVGLRRRCVVHDRAARGIGPVGDRDDRNTGWFRLDSEWQKRFISNAPWADWYAVLAKTGDKSLGVFIVHKDDDGVSFGAPEKKMGMRGSPTADVVLDGCRLPAVRVVNDPNKGFQYISAELNGSRALIAAQALGIAQGAFDAAVSYTTNRDQFGQPISRFQLLRGMVADMAVKIESARSLLYDAVHLIQDGDPAARAKVAMAKLLCSDNAMSVTTDALQLHGGYGYVRDYPVERMMRDAKITQIYEGTNQIQRLLIAKSVYGK